MKEVSDQPSLVSRQLVEHPLLVIGVPCYNEAAYLERTLTSIAQQTMRDFEVLVSDNASTDGMEEIARSFCESDVRFTYWRQPVNIGAARNFNFTLDGTKSPYFLWVGGHDLLEPSMVERHLRVLEARPEVSVSQSAHAWVDTEGRVIERIEDGDLDGGECDDPHRYLRSIGQNRNNIAGNSLIRRSMLGATRLTDVVGTDRILLSHLAFRGPFATLDDVLYYRRTFAERAHNNPYMERLTGRLGESEDWTAFAREYDQDFAALLGDRAGSTWLRRKLALTLRYHLPVQRDSLLTRSLWTTRRARKWVGKGAALLLGHRR